MCTGVKQWKNEPIKDYEKRVDNFKAARERCRTLKLKAEAAKKNENNEIVLRGAHKRRGVAPDSHPRGTARVFVFAWWVSRTFTTAAPWRPGRPAAAAYTLAVTKYSSTGVAVE